MEITGTSVSYYVYDDKVSDWPNWMTNEDGTIWYNLMGMSYEEIDPPEYLLDFFKKEVHNYVFN